MKEILSNDLPDQYERDMDWSIYSEDVVFADPVTLTHGLLLYKGMILTLRLMTSTLFEPGTARFDLFSIEEVGLSPICRCESTSVPCGVLRRGAEQLRRTEERGMNGVLIGG